MCPKLNMCLLSIQSGNYCMEETRGVPYLTRGSSSHWSAHALSSSDVVDAVLTFVVMLSSSSSCCHLVVSSSRRLCHLHDVCRHLTASFLAIIVSSRHRVFVSSSLDSSSLGLAAYAVGYRPSSSSHLS